MSKSKETLSCNSNQGSYQTETIPYLHVYTWKKLGNTRCYQICFHVDSCGCTRVQNAPSIEVVQINLHPGANCAHERKPYNFLYILIGDFDIWQAISFTMLFKFD